MGSKFKKIIARFGLYGLGLIVLGGVVAVIIPPLLPIFFWLASAYLILFGVYLLLRFVVWAVKTLKE